MSQSTELEGEDRFEGTVIDFGAHLYPEQLFPEHEYAEVLERSPYDGERSRQPYLDLLGSRFYDPEILTDLYDRAGYDRAVLSLPYYMGHDDINETQTANDKLLEIVQSSEMFYGLASIPVAAGGETAAEEFERALDDGYNGGAVSARNGDVELDDSELEPVYEVAVEHDAPLFVHPVLNESLHPDVLDDTYLLNAVFGREIVQAESICKVVHAGVFDRYPDLDMVYHHHGGNIASFIGRLFIQLDSGRFPDRQIYIKDFYEFKEQLEENIYIDTCGYLAHPGPTRTALEVFPDSQVLLGTDYPFEPRSVRELRKYISTIRDHTSYNGARNVLGENAMSLLTNVEE